MRSIPSILLRVALVAAGLVAAASLVLVSVLLAVLWALRAAWSKLTGRTVAPFVVRFRAGATPSRARRAAQGDVIDVEARHLS